MSETGFIYPFEVYQGSIKLTSDYPTLVKNAILSSLNTELEERVFRPTYGLDPQEFQAVDNLATVLTTCRQAIALGLEDYPDVEFDLRGRVDDSGMVEILVVYNVADSISDSVEVVVG